MRLELKPGAGDRLLAAQQVARILGIHARTVTRMVQRGELAAYRIGRRLRFDERDLEQYLVRNRIDAKP